MTNLKKLKEIAEAAFPGPWIKGSESGQCHLKHQHGAGNCVYEYTINPGNCVLAPRSGGQSITLIGWNEYGEVLSPQDATFIATLNPTVVLALLSVIEAADEMTEPLSSRRSETYKEKREALQKLIGEL